MKKSTFRKYSVLGLVLVAASAVTAAIMPNKTSEEITGKIVVDSTGGPVQFEKTCIPSELNECKVTLPTASTTDGNPNNGRQSNGTSVPISANNTTT